MLRARPVPGSCQKFARLSWELTGESLPARTGLRGGEALHAVPNYVDTGEMPPRKGAVAAHKGEKTLIPINMGDGSIWAVGRGNPQQSGSAPQRGPPDGPGAAHQALDMVKGIGTACANPSPQDEGPWPANPWRASPAP